jgi:hypothetical protein
VTEEIFANERSVQVEANLKSGLNELRAQGFLVLWVDALCINQKDLLERGLQVMRMGLIYSRAAEVLVWLGEEADGSAIAMSEVEGSSRKLLVAESNHREGFYMKLRAGTLATTHRHAIIVGDAFTALF